MYFYTNRQIATYVLLASLPLFALFPSRLVASALTLAWDPNTEDDLAGYKVYYGTRSRDYDYVIDVGNVTQYTVTSLESEKRYYFAVTAYDTSENESSFSEEVTGEAPNIHTLTPPSNTAVPQGGYLGPFYASVTNNTNSSYSLYLNPYIVTPEEDWILMFSNLITLGAGETNYANNGNAVYIGVSPFARTGTHSHYVNVYDTNDNLVDQDGFSFEVTAASSAQRVENLEGLIRLMEAPGAKVHLKNGWKMIIVPKKQQ